MRHILFILSFLFLVVTHGFVAGASLESVEYKRYSEMSTERLSDLGRRYLSDKQKQDSALIFYTIIANRYKEKDGSPSDMRCYALALNNLGYLYGGYYLDFERAYGYLQRAIAVSKQYHIDDNLSYAYLNLACIYLNRDKLFGISDTDQKTLKYSRMAFDEAVKQKQWDVASVSFFNLFTASYDSGHIGEIQHDVQRFLNIPALKQDPLSKFVLDDYQGFQAFKAKKYQEALSWFEKQLSDADAVKGVSSNCKVLALWNIYKVYYSTARWREASAVLERIDRHASEYNDAAIHNRVLCNWVELYRGQGKNDLAEHYDYLYLKSKDSLLRKSNAERMERSAFVHELSQMNNQLAESQARHRHMVLVVVVLLAFITVIVIALVVNIRGLRKQKAYVKKLYEKNMELLSRKPTTPTPRPTADSRPSAINEELKNALSERIEHTINDPKIFTAQDFSLHQLAFLVESNDKYVSQIINERYNKNFKQLLNEIRVAEACRRLGDQDRFGHLTIAGIAEDVGFGSRSNFALVFKRITGISPSDFLHQARQER